MFEASVYPILLVRCEDCHAPGRVAGDSRLVITGNARSDRAMVVALVSAYLFTTQYYLPATLRRYGIAAPEVSQESETKKKNAAEDFFFVAAQGCEVDTPEELDLSVAADYRDRLLAAAGGGTRFGRR